MSLGDNLDYVLSQIALRAPICLTQSVSFVDVGVGMLYCSMLLLKPGKVATLC